MSWASRLVHASVCERSLPVHWPSIWGFALVRKDEVSQRRTGRRGWINSDTGASIARDGASGHHAVSGYGRMHIAVDSHGSGDRTELPAGMGDRRAHDVCTVV